MPGALVALRMPSPFPNSLSLEGEGSEFLARHAICTRQHFPAIRALCREEGDDVAVLVGEFDVVHTRAAALRLFPPTATSVSPRRAGARISMLKPLATVFWLQALQA